MTAVEDHDYPGDAWADEQGDLHAAGSAARVHERYVEAEVAKLRIREDARRVLAREQGGIAGRPSPVALRDLLAEPEEPITYRVEGLLPSAGRALLAAQAKAGKTTLVGNLLRCLIDGDPFLDRHEVSAPRRVALLDTEMPRGMLRRWLADQRIRQPGRLEVYCLRGQVASFDVLDPVIRREWASELYALDVEVAILDCLKPILDALGLDENADVGRVLVALDALATEAEIAELVLVHHMGHTAERSRGSSRLRDWPDVEWKLVREDPDDPASPRFFSAYGRDVEVAETRLVYDAASRRLSAAGGSRKTAATAVVMTAVLKLLGHSVDPLSGRGVEDALVPDGHAKRDVREALAALVRQGRVRTASGPRRAVLHSLAECPEDLISTSAPSAPPVRQRSESECASAYIGRTALTHSSHNGSAPTGALTCSRCQYPAERLVPPDDRCERCAYPAGGAPGEDTEENHQ